MGRRIRRSTSNLPSRTSPRARRGLPVNAAGMAEGTAKLRRNTKDSTIHTLVGSRPIGFSGDGGPAAEAQVAGPAFMAVDSSRELVFADYLHQPARQISPGR